MSMRVMKQLYIHPTKEFFSPNFDLYVLQIKDRAITSTLISPTTKLNVKK